MTEAQRWCVPKCPNKRSIPSSTAIIETFFVFASMYVKRYDTQLHMSVMYEHERKAHTTPRLQQHTTRVGALPQSHPGLCGTPLVPVRTPTVHGCPNSEGRGWPDVNHHEDDHRQTTTRHQPVSRQVLSGNKCRHAHVTLIL